MLERRLLSRLPCWDDVDRIIDGLPDLRAVCGLDRIANAHLHGRLHLFQFQEHSTLVDQPGVEDFDFVEDNDIDGKDFLAWQSGFGIIAPNGTKGDGDANDDQNVDAVDLGFWLQQFGLAESPAPLSVAATVMSATGADGTCQRL